MDTMTLTLNHASVPAVLYGFPSPQVWLCLHGKGGRKEEAESFAQVVCPKGWQVLAIDLPGHGARSGGPELFTPWHAVPELRDLLSLAGQKWNRLALRAVSLGAWFSLLAFQDRPLDRALFVSPVLDMERLIQEMMSWAGVTESRLEAEGEISTEFGETLSWPYLQYVRAHPVSRWETPTRRLGAARFCGGGAQCATPSAAVRGQRERGAPLLPDCGGGDGALVPYPGTAGGSEAVGGGEHMKILISPAKKMRTDTDTLSPQALPAFLPETERLLSALRSLSRQELKQLWRCSDAITDLNVERLARMELGKGLTPALLSYQGIQYQYMAPGVFETGQFTYLQEHLRILSGFYGMLRPFDGVTPYRLEMQARLSVNGCPDLYAFWGDRLARALAGEAGLVVDLASQEYSRAVLPHLPPSVEVLTCTFGELRKDGRVVEKGTLCKMARGQMVRWMAERGVRRSEELKDFQDLGYRYDAAHSGHDHYVFLKEKEGF